MKRWAVALVAGLCVGAVALAACGGGSDEGDKTATGTKTSKTTTPGASGTASNVGGTPGADGTSTSGTPGVSGTPGAGKTPGAAGTPRPVETIVGSGNTPVASGAPVTPTSAERDATDTGGEVPEDIIGGDLDAEPEVLNDLPEPPPAATIDSTTIAPANTGASGIEAIIDVNASEAGIQSARTIKVGDVIRVGLVLSNVPTEGLAAFNFRLNYDRTRIVAPTIINGSSLARNPDMNEDGVGSGADGWNCLLPAPQGDTDDPGGFTGDGDPATGQAAISCIGAPPMDYETGDIVFATVQFQAIASGSVTLAFHESDAQWFDSLIQQLGSCGGVEPVIPCRSATLTVE